MRHASEIFDPQQGCRYRSDYTEPSKSLFDFPLSKT
jgi:hypothetical protein